MDTHVESVAIAGSLKDTNMTPESSAERRKRHQAQPEASESIDGEYGALSNLVSRYVGQLTLGCENAECRNALCYAGKRNKSNKPVRRPTPRSARAIAIALVGSEEPDKYICEHFHFSQASSERQSLAEGPRDTASLLQSFSDTEVIKTFASGTSTGKSGSTDVRIPIPEPIVHQIRGILDVSQCLDGLRTPPLKPSGERNPDFVSNNSTARQIVHLCDFMCHEIYVPLLATGEAVAHETLITVEHMVSHHAFQWALEPAVTRFMVFSDFLALMDKLHSDQVSHLSREIFQTVAYRTLLDDTWKKTDRRPIDKDESILTLAAYPLVFLLNSRNAVFGPPKPDEDHETKSIKRQISDLLQCAWMKSVFLKNWDGRPVLRRGTAACGVLELLAVMYTIRCLFAKTKPVQFFNISAIHYQVDDVELAESFLAHEEPATKSIHLLHFRFLFTDRERLKYFRIMNHLKMQATHTTVTVIERLGEQLIGEPPACVVGPVRDRLEATRSDFILLSVGRDNILEDSFDQLWKRRRSELLKPLRVRLEEMDGLELGQDLGGVQIEFFNLVMQAALREEAGLFATDSSGLSYFRPASLQPLHMFECFGTLVALAIYNGIAIPVTFPSAFYRNLLNLECDRPEHIEDRWSSEAKSMGDILSSDVSHWGLGSDFSLEVTGVRYTIPRPYLSETDDHYDDADSDSAQACMYIKDAAEVTTAQGQTDLAEQLSNLDSPKKAQSESSWPGWVCINGQHSPNEDVTNDNKEKYVRDYINWITNWSIKPQLDRFRKGFYHVLDAHTLSLFTPESLKSAVEGTTKMDVEELRRGTVYEGFEPNDPYIDSFWAIIKSWSQERQKALVRFVTAVERLPAAGAEMLTFKIQRSDIGAQQGHLPTSSTCFGTLYLPVYENASILEDKLITAIELGEYGFGTG